MSAEDKVDKEEEGFPVAYIRNFPFPTGEFFKSKNIEECLDYRPINDDIILCSYPKTGTTWIQYIVWLILHKGESFPDFSDMTQKCVPFMEIVGIEPVKTLTPPRFYKNHFPYHLMNINENAKYIYIYRKPEDTVVSFYYFLMNREGRSFKFDDFFESFMSGKLAYGSYFDHVLSFYEHKDDPHLLFVSYEDLHLDKRKQILRIARFMGEDYYNAVVSSDSLMDKILTLTTFEYMKGHLKSVVVKTDETSGTSETNIAMFRKGVVGDGKNILSPEQMKRLKEKILEKMKGTELVQKWLN